MLHIIEVKCRNFFPGGAHPEENVTRKKFRNLQRAADKFLSFHPQYKWIQYDILAITVYKDKEAEYFLLQDVYL
jgi:putative endonuclease